MGTRATQKSESGKSPAFVYFSGRTSVSNTMKTKGRFRSAVDRRDTDGMAVIVVMILISILTIYLAFNLRTLGHLTRELRLVERQQIRRLQTMTNAPAATANLSQPTSPL
jgi:hypothetical protein